MYTTKAPSQPPNHGPLVGLIPDELKTLSIPNKPSRLTRTSSRPKVLKRATPDPTLFYGNIPKGQCHLRPNDILSQFFKRQKKR